MVATPGSLSKSVEIPGRCQGHLPDQFPRLATTERHTCSGSR